MLKITSDILDFSKIESKQLKLILSHLIVAAAFFCYFYLTLIAKKTWLSTVLSNLTYQKIVNSDPVRVQQVISNLLNNSIKFTDGMYYLHLL